MICSWVKSNAAAIAKEYLFASAKLCKSFFIEGAFLRAWDIRSKVTAWMPAVYLWASSSILLSGILSLSGIS